MKYRWVFISSDSWASSEISLYLTVETMLMQDLAVETKWPMSTSRLMKETESHQLHLLKEIQASQKSAYKTEGTEQH